MSNSIEKTLAERGPRYGNFEVQALVAQNIKAAFYTGNWCKLAPDQKECLEMIAVKLSRILVGDPDYQDSWHDIIGYTKLVEDRLVRDLK